MSAPDSNDMFAGMNDMELIREKKKAGKRTLNTLFVSPPQGNWGQTPINFLGPGSNARAGLAQERHGCTTPVQRGLLWV